MFGFYRVASAVPRLYLANPKENLKEIIKILEEMKTKSISAVVFPEMALTGYTVSDLFFQKSLYYEQMKALEELKAYSADFGGVIILGIALMLKDRLYNCAVVLQNGYIKGVIPKQFLPMKREFYEKRHFSNPKELDSLESIELLGEEVAIGLNLIFDDGEFSLGVEICEDLWSLEPPSSKLALSGAKIIFNPSASNELIGKAEYRAELVRTQSARTISAYVYSSSGVWESSTDTIFGGDSIIAEYGSILARGERFNLQSSYITADIDIERLNALRVAEGNFNDGELDSQIRVIKLDRLLPLAIHKLDRVVPPYPFVPLNESEREKRCKEIVSIQAYSLIRRLHASKAKKAVIGISGGLDSTLALLSTHKAFEIESRDSRDIIAVTMPGFGTTDRTYQNAIKLAKELNVTLKEIDITKLSLLEFEAIGYDKNKQDVTYENVQARARTEILMNIANMQNGIVIGTGDLSEIALGWSTYNGDHMSMYALNSGIPKTLIRYIIEYFAKSESNLKEILEDILDTPVSPELLPHQDGEISQKTEEIVGPYELHDFFLYNFVKYGFRVSKIAILAKIAFKDRYSLDEIKRWLRVFISRFFSQQFKRSCMPDGPKVGTISLSPRADWRMPSDASAQIWLDELDNMEVIL